MAGTPVNPAMEKATIDLYDSGVRSISAISRDTGLDRATVRKILIRAGRLEIKLVEARAPVPRVAPEPAVSPTGENVESTLSNSPEPAPNPAEAEVGADTSVDRKWTEKGDDATVECGSPVRIRTLEDAIAHAEVDTSVWYVLDWECTAWQVSMKLRSFDGRGKVIGETPVTRDLWRLKMRLRRIMPKPFLEATEALFRRIEERAFRFDAPRFKRDKPKYLLELDLPDVHFGKLCWNKETGSDYDLKIAEQVYRNGFADLLEESSGYNPSQIVIPIGNDFFHVDNANSTTTAGTYVDSDGRYPKIIECGTAAMVGAVELALQVAPVRLILVRGNHDWTASWHLARWLQAYFRNAKHVEVDCEPASRKYLRWGWNLTGYTHGHQVKPEKLPLIMATERPQDWAETRCREWHLGHLHHPKAFETKSVASHNGVRVRHLMSLSGTDLWHYDMGFIGEPPAAEAYVYRWEGGIASHFSVPARAA